MVVKLALSEHCLSTTASWVWHPALSCGMATVAKYDRKSFLGSLIRIRVSFTNIDHTSPLKTESTDNVQCMLGVLWGSLTPTQHVHVCKHTRILSEKPKQLKEQVLDETVSV